MKVFALILLFVAAASARSTGVKAVSSRAELGENPWLVHLRIAISTSGFLQTCSGSLIDARWVLTTASCLESARFIWVRYGVVNVFNPSLVTETSAVRIHPQYDSETGENNIALISLNRFVLNPANDNIAPVKLVSADEDAPESGKFCGFGAGENGPGENLSCFDVDVSDQNGFLVAQSEDGESTKYDIGAPLVEDGVQYGVLVKEADGDNAGVFLSPAAYREWIERTANIVLPGGEENNSESESDSSEDSESSDSSDSSDSSESEEEGRQVQFVDA